MQVIKTNKIKRYKYAGWSQPVFTAEQVKVNNVWYKITASSIYNINQDAFLAFNNNITTSNNAWMSQASTAISESAPEWICMECSSKLKLTKVDIMNEVASAYNFKTGFVQASNDYKTWTNLAALNGTNTVKTVTTVTMAPTQPYRFYRLLFTSSFNSGSKCVSLQNVIFYGTIAQEVTTPDYEFCEIVESYSR